MHKKGQITFFIILGVLVISILGFVLLFSTGEEKQEVEQQLTTIQVTKQQQDRINDYIATCLENALDEAVQSIGLQGGIFFKNQQGSSIPWEQKKVPFRNPDVNISTNVSYAIQRVATDNPPLNSFATNQYPCLSCSPKLQTGPPNYCEYHIGDRCAFGKTVVQPLKRSPFSFENQIEYLVFNHTQECVKEEDLQNVIGAEPIIHAQEMQLNVTIGEKSVSSSLTLPLEFVSLNAESSTKTMSFTVSSPVRLYAMHRALQDAFFGLIVQEENNIEHDVLEDGLTTLREKFSPALSLKKYENVVGYDDVIAVIDNTFKTSKGPYVLQFVRENRPPVLDYIFHNSVDLDYHVRVAAGTPIIFRPSGADPDEDELSYHYEGWKADYDELSGTRKSIAVNHWESSTEYRQTKREASILTEDGDVGEHEVKISVSDGQFSDWQTVNILVEPADDRIINLRQLFSTEASFMSKEDPVYLDIKTSNLPGDPNNYVFKWILNGVTLYEGTEECIVLPGQIPCDDQNALNAAFTSTNAASPINEITSIHPFETFSTGNYILRVEAKHISGTNQINDQEEIQIVDCVPHQGSLSAYPFGTLESSYGSSTDAFKDFLLEHTCCTAEYEHKSAGERCYNINSQTARSGLQYDHSCSGSRGNTCRVIGNTP